MRRELATGHVSNSVSHRNALLGHDRRRRISRNVAEDLGDDVISGDAFGFCFEIQNEAVPQGGGRDSFNVIEADIEAAVGEGADFAGEDQGLATARAASEPEILAGDWSGSISFWVSREDEAHGVIFYVGSDWDIANNLHQFDQRFSLQDLLHIGASASGCAGEDFGQFTSRWVADENFEKEAIELGFGQRVSAFLVNGVLRRHDEEGLDEFPYFTARRDAMLLHGFEEGGLRFGRGTVDFVGKDEVSEDGAVLELKFAASAPCFHDDVGAENIGGHEVGSELNAVEREIEHFAQRAHE